MKSIVSSPLNFTSYLITILGYCFLIGFWILFIIFYRSFTSSVLKTIVNVLPTPTYDFKFIAPLNYSTIIFEIWRPSPIPLVLSCSVVDKNPNNLKSFPRSGAEIPTPVSTTWICKSPCLSRINCLELSSCSRSSNWNILRLIILTFPPDEVNFRALD